MYTWNSMPTMPRSSLGAMFWRASRPRTCSKFWITWPSFGQFTSPLLSLSCTFEHASHVLAFTPDYNIQFLFFVFLQIPCSKSRQFPCQNLCGNLLHCGNHYCTKDCHVLEIPSDQRKADTILSLSRNNTLAEPCERCNLRCQRVSSFFVSLCNTFSLVVLFINFNVKWLVELHIFLLSLVHDV